MISKEIYEQIRKEHGSHSSWALWADVVDTPKSGVSDLRVFDDKVYEKLNPNYVFVGLNPSVQDVKPEDWCNFHSRDTKRQNDYKLRFALKGTKFWGSYMTDLKSPIKETDSNKVSVSEDDVNSFMVEISLLGTKPVLIALGSKVYKALTKHKNLPNECKIVKIRHYSSFISKEKYRKEVLDILANV